MVEAHGPDFSESRKAQTDQLIRAHMRQEAVPALSIAIVAGGRIAYAKGFGWANLEDSTRVATSTLFTR